MKKILLIFAFFFVVSVANAKASSNYVLPYPSVMPGSIFYKLHLVEEKLLQYWYFGEFGQFEYNLKESDKYLVESKTLFEYNQYLLGYNALKKSDSYFIKTLPYLLNAQKEGKNISANRELLREASRKHIETLLEVKQEVPETFNWSPEKSPSTELKLFNAINNSIKIRMEDL